ncbi:MAG: acyltransferase [Paracoccaceae bacterium]
MPKQPGIQLLRALAAIMVLIGHVLAEAEHYFSTTLPFSNFPWSRGVDIFFVISGFIITLSAQRLQTQPDAARRFLWRRFIRVAPLYYLFTTLMIVALVLVPGGAKDTQFDLGQIVSSYLFWPYERYDGRLAPVLSLGWTLNYEMFFYLIFAAALALPKRVGSLAVVGFISFLSAVGVIFSPEFTPVAFWTNPTMMAFAYGVLIARADLAGIGPKRGGLLVLMVGVAALMILNTDSMSLPRFISSGIPAAIIVSAPVLFSRQGGGPRLGLLLGDASYALYLSHRFVLRLATLLLLPYLPSTETAAWVFVSLVSLAALVVSLGVYRWIEEPMLRAMRPAS